MTGLSIEQAAADFLRQFGPHALRSLAEHTALGWPRDAVLRSTPGAHALLAALDDAEHSSAVAYLSGLAAGYTLRADDVSVESVWSGPASHRVPVRATAAVLTDLINAARHAAASPSAGGQAGESSGKRLTPSP